MHIQGFAKCEIYYQEKKKFEKSKKSGSGSDKVYVSRIKWFTEMDAILKDMDVRRTFDNVSIF